MFCWWGHPRFVASRTNSNLDSFVFEIEKSTGMTMYVCTDKTYEDQVKSLFDVEGQNIYLTNFYPAFGFSGKIIDMDPIFLKRDRS